MNKLKASGVHINFTCLSLAFAQHFTDSWFLVISKTTVSTTFILQVLEQKHTVEINDLIEQLEGMEERAENAENTLDDVKIALLQVNFVALFFIVLLFGFSRWRFSFLAWKLFLWSTVHSSEQNNLFYSLIYFIGGSPLRPHPTCSLEYPRSWWMFGISFIYTKQKFPRRIV